MRRAIYRVFIIIHCVFLFTANLFYTPLINETPDVGHHACGCNSKNLGLQLDISSCREPVEEAEEGNEVHVSIDPRPDAMLISGSSPVREHDLVFFLIYLFVEIPPLCSTPFRLRLLCDIPLTTRLYLRFIQLPSLYSEFFLSNQNKNTLRQSTYNTVHAV